MNEQVEPIFAPEIGLGDNWYALNAYMRMPVARVEVSRWSKAEQGRVDVGRRLREILALLNGPIDKVVVTDALPTYRKADWWTWDVEYFPTWIQWAPNRSGRLAYQFDGRSSAAGKNPSTSESERLLTSLSGYELVRLGDHLSLQRCVELLASCEALVCVCSGLSHVCHSVGTPLFLLEYSQGVERFRVGKRYFRCVGTDAAITAVRAFMGRS